MVFVAPNVVLSYTDSVNYHLLYRLGGTPAEGQLANFPMQHPYILKGEESLLTKRVACTEGQMLETRGNRHFCDGVTLGVALKQTEDGRPLTQFVFDGPIPAGMAFMPRRSSALVRQAGILAWCV